MDDLSDMIDKIISVEEEAENRFESDERLRLKSEQKIIDLQRAKKEEYLKKARMNIGVVEKIEKIRVQEKIKSINEYYRKLMESLNENYKKNKERIGREIVFRVKELK